MRRAAKTAGMYHHGDLRRVLLDEAVRVIERDGVGTLNLHALARKARVSSGAPYHHFESREQLLVAIALEGYELLAIEMRRCADEAEASAAHGTETPATAWLRGLGRGYVRFALAHPGHFRAMFRPELKVHLQKHPHVADEAFTLLKLAITRCQEEGSIAAGDPRPFILLAWSAVHGVSVLWIDGSLSRENLVADGDALGAAIADTLAGLLRPASLARSTHR